MEITVKSKFIKTTPRKIRLVAGAVKYKKATEAASLLKFINKEAATPIYKTLKSALAIVKEKQLEEDKFILSGISCNQGPRIKRQIMKSRGQSSLIQKRMAHLILTISDNHKISPKSDKRTKKATQAKKENNKE